MKQIAHFVRLHSLYNKAKCHNFMDSWKWKKRAKGPETWGPDGIEEKNVGKGKRNALLKILPQGFLSELSSLSYHTPHPTHTRSVANLGRSQPVLHEDPGSTPAHSSQTEVWAQLGLVSTRANARSPLCGQELRSHPGVCEGLVHQQNINRASCSSTLPVLLLQPHAPRVCISRRHISSAKFSRLILKTVAFSVEESLAWSKVPGFVMATGSCTKEHMLGGKGSLFREGPSVPCEDASPSQVTLQPGLLHGSLLRTREFETKWVRNR